MLHGHASRSSLVLPAPHLLLVFGLSLCFVRPLSDLLLVWPRLEIITAEAHTSTAYLLSSLQSKPLYSLIHSTYLRGLETRLEAVALTRIILSPRIRNVSSLRQRRC
jgi:hypothetical protein